MSASDGDPRIFKFGEFVVDVQERVLLRGDLAVSLTPKVFDTLLVFLRRPGVTLTKEELLTTIWHDKLVEESNIVQNVAVLRKALNDSSHECRFIATIPGCGYRFIAPVTYETGVVKSAYQDTNRFAAPDRGQLAQYSSKLAAIATLGLRSARRSRQILFCGFYEVSEKGRHLTKTPLTRRLETEFFTAFESGFRSHGVQDYHPVGVADIKLPALLYRWCDQDRFDRFLRVYSERAVGIVWGIVGRDGIQSLEVKLNSLPNTRSIKAKDQLNRLVRVVNRSGILPEKKARYLGTVLAAVWCQSFCNDIASRGDWQAAHNLAVESRRRIEAALREVASKAREQRALTLLTRCYCQSHAFR